MTLLDRLRRRPADEDPAAWFRLLSTDPAARARAIASIEAAAPPVAAAPADAPPMLRSARR